MKSGKTTLYFSDGGPHNTEATLEKVQETVLEENIQYVVVATGGKTLHQAAHLFQKEMASGLTLVGVTLQAGTWKEYGEPNWDVLEEARSLGAKVLTCTHSLMGSVESAVMKKFGGLPPAELIAYTYYTFSQGTKVAVEVTLSAVDAGIIPAGVDAVGVGGSGEGADTALLLHTVSTVDFFDLKIREVLCKPR